MSSPVEIAASVLRELGAELKQSKSGHILVVDFRPVARQVTDGHLTHLRPLEKLRKVYLDGAAITDAALENLAELVKLTTIDLQNTCVTDNGIQRLKALPSLKLLLLNGANVTRDGINQMRKSMLKTRIVFI